MLHLNRLYQLTEAAPSLISNGREGHPLPASLPVASENGLRLTCIVVCETLTSVYQTESNQGWS